MDDLDARMPGNFEAQSPVKESVTGRIRRAYLAVLSTAVIGLAGSGWMLHRLIASLQSGPIRSLSDPDTLGQIPQLEVLPNTLERIGTLGILANVVVMVLLIVTAVVLFEPVLRLLRKRDAELSPELNLNRLFKDLANITHNSVVVTDTQGLIKWVNPSFTQLTGFTLAEAQGKKPGALLQRDDADATVIERMSQGLKKDGRFSELILNYSKEGRPFWIKIDCQPLRSHDDTPVGFIAVQMDITEMRRRQAELQSANLRFRFATQVARVGVWELATKSGAMWWSDTLYETLGIAKKESAPTFADLLSVICPDDRQAFELSVDVAIANEEMLRTRLRIVRSAGDRRTIDMTAAVSREADTGARRLIGIALDVTDQLAQRDKERQLQAQLLNISRQAGMAEVATGVLHSIGNVLNSLGINLSSAKESLRNLKIDRVEQMGAMLTEHAGHLDKFFAEDPRAQRIPEYFPVLVEHMRETIQEVEKKLTSVESFVAHIYKSVQLQQTHGRVSGMKENVDVREVLEVACAMQAYRKNIVDGSVTIIRDFEAVPIVEMQRHKLLDVLGNLVTNAIDAVQQADNPEKVIRLSTRHSRQGVEITVADTGCGISKENLERIWEFGFTTKATGHGFGLHSSALVVNEIGGHMSVFSQGVGCGTTFTVWLPSAPDGDSGRIAA